MPTPAHPSPPGRPPHHPRALAQPGPNQGGRHDTSHPHPTHQPPAGYRHRQLLRRLPVAVALGAILLVVVASPAFAAGGGAPTLSGVIDNLRNWIVGILAGVATLFLTIGGLRYLTAGGDPGQVEKAKTALEVRRHRLRPRHPGPAAGVHPGLDRGRMKMTWLRRVPAPPPVPFRRRPRPRRGTGTRRQRTPRHGPGSPIGHHGRRCIRAHSGQDRHADDHDTVELSGRSGPPGIQVGPGGTTTPTTPTPGSGGSVSGGSQPSPGLFDITGHIEAAIDSWFRDLVTAALDPILTLLGHTLLATPNVTAQSRVGELWR